MAMVLQSMFAASHSLARPQPLSKGVPQQSSHVTQARGSRHTVQMEDRKDKQAWRQELQQKFGGEVRLDDAAEQAEPQGERIVISRFGDTVDPAVLRELEEEDATHLAEEQVLEEISIEDIFNIDADQMDDLQHGNLLDAGWDVADLEDEEDDEDVWEVLDDIPAAQEPLTNTGRSRNLRREEIQERWQQSAALQALPKEVLKQLQAYQEEADLLREELKRKRKGSAGAEQKTHRQLRLISGSMAGRKLLSGTGESTRPMMEKVRAAAFDMLLARCGSMAGLPPGSKWLDLFAGTGSVGLEAMSRGVESCHFIEMDKWVVDKVLSPNLSSCQVREQCLVHTMKAEHYLQRALEAPEYAQSFDFVSVCPPYLKVSYPELFGLLAESPLIHPESHILVEYPRKEKQNIPESVGPLSLVKDRKFGRTYLAIYGPE